MLSLLSTILVAASPGDALLGFHPCGDHWNKYGNFCEFYRDGESTKVRSYGDNAKIEGQVRWLEDGNFVIHGTVRQLKEPWDDPEFPDTCQLEGSYTFRRTAKRSYWRFLKRCDGTHLVWYFDIFEKAVPKERVKRRLETLGSKAASKL